MYGMREVKRGEKSRLSRRKVQQIRKGRRSREERRVLYSGRAIERY